MSGAKESIPSAPLMDNEVVGMAAPPPSYDETMGLSGGYAQTPQYPPQPPYGPHPPYPVQQPLPHLPYPSQPYYGGAGYTTPHGPPQAAPVQLHSLASPQPQPPPPVNVCQVQLRSVVVGPKPVTATCPACRMNVKTSTVTENKTGAHVCCVLLCLVGCCLFSCIPYCTDSCKKVRHTCPNCGNYMGTYTA